MAEETVYSMGSALPCGHKLDPKDESAPRLLQKAGGRGKLRCPRCKKEKWFLIDGSVATFQELWNERFLKSLQDIEATIAKQEKSKRTHWEKAPKLEKFMREPPTEEEEKKHEEIKQTLTEHQQTATDALKEAFKGRNTEFLLCEDDLEDADQVTDILQFMLSDYANEGNEELQGRKKEAIPVLRLTKANFDSSEDVEYEGKGKLLQKGGLFYYEPGSEWFKVGLKVSGQYEDEDWYKSSDESKAWAIAYHGSNVAGNQAIAEERQFETAGKRQLHSCDTDKNPFSTNFGEMCGTGAYFSNLFNVALGYAEKAENGETCVFEVHLKPSEMRVPERNTQYAIVNDSTFARPTGICIRRSVEKPKFCQLM